MSFTDANPPSEVHRLALEKMSTVLGAERAHVLLKTLLRDPLIELQTADDLLRFSEALSRCGGFEGAVGAMLGVAAVMRGAG
jgi:hypothetical protein